MAVSTNPQANDMGRIKVVGDCCFETHTIEFLFSGRHCGVLSEETDRIPVQVEIDITPRSAVKGLRCPSSFTSNGREKVSIPYRWAKGHRSRINVSLTCHHPGRELFQCYQIKFLRSNLE